MRNVTRWILFSVAFFVAQPLLQARTSGAKQAGNGNKATGASKTDPAKPAPDAGAKDASDAGAGAASKPDAGNADANKAGAKTGDATKAAKKAAPKRVKKATRRTRKAANKTRRRDRKAKRRRYEKTKDIVAGGRHWRIETERGPLHVWIPRGYHRPKAGMVVYIHGHRTTADQAWKHHKLPQQFRKSRQNAMFVVPEAPINGTQPIHWPSLAKMKRAISRAGIRMPDGPTVVIGHSGAFRTIAKWVDHRVLAEVILLDALYGRQSQFLEFIHKGKRAKHHKLVLVAANDTLKRSQEFVSKLRYATVKKRFPKSYRGFTKRERNTKLLFIQSQYSHMGLVVNEKVIPIILRITPLKRL